MIDDISSSQGKILTDGGGKISPAQMEVILNLFDPSRERQGHSIQIRCMGFKGILTIDSDIPEEGLGSIQFRPSMLKFDVDKPEGILGVVKVFECSPLRLNRDVLTLLFSLGKEGPAGGEWRPASYIERLQEAELQKICELLLDEEKARLQLRSSLSFVATKELYSDSIDFKLLSDPFFFELLQQIYISKTRSLRRKAHIPVEQACLLVGVPDPKGVLKDGEIFIKIKFAGENEARIITGPIMIYRNPCLFPGDIRIVNAVDELALHFLENVLVMPASDTVKTSLASECSGGDNDGDEFSCIWDPNLVPPKNREAEAFDYDGFQMQRAKEVPPNEELALEQTVINCMCNQSLGRIAHTHLAVADLKDESANDPLAIDLAKSHCQAVDYSKTGIAPTISIEAKKLVCMRGYPDFMEKKGLSYCSKKPLGALYRRSVALVPEIHLGEVSATSIQVPDVRFQYPGAELFRESALKNYDHFVNDMKRIMVHFDLQSEAEAILLMPTTWRDEEFAPNCGASLQSLRETVNALRLKYLKVFHRDERLLLDQNEMKAKASAWYSVAYEHQQFRSFAWVVSDTLISILSQPQIAMTPLTSGSFDARFDGIGGAILSSWTKSAQSLLITVARKEALFQKLQQMCLSHSLKKYGSVELLLCDDLSDLDVCAPIPFDIRAINEASPLNDIEAHYLEVHIYPRVYTRSRSELFRNRTIPLIKVAFDLESKYSIDICAKEDGVNKAMLIRILYSLHPTHLLFFSSLMEWARASGVVRWASSSNASSGAGFIRTGEFHAIMVSFLMQYRKYVMEDINALVNSYQRAPDSCLIDSAISSNAADLSLLLFSFFEFGFSMKNEFLYEWPLPGSPVHELNGDTVSQFSSKCGRSLHSLALSRSWLFCLKHASDHEKAETSFTYNFDRNLSEKLGDIKDFHAAKLANQSGASITIACRGNGSDELEDDSIARGKGSNVALVLHATGSCFQIKLLRAALLELINYSRCQYVGIIRSLASKYFIEGATLLYARHAETKKTVLHVEDYFGPSGRCFHETNRLSTLHCHPRAEPYMGWKDVFKSSMKEKIITQLETFDPSKGSSLRMSIHFGRFYLVNAHLCLSKFTNVSIEEIEVAINNNKHRANDDRPSFNPTLPIDYGKIHADSRVDTKRENTTSSNITRCKADGSRLPPKRKSSMLASGYYSSLCTSEEVEFNSDKALQSISSALKGLGFAEAKNSAAKLPTGNYNNSKWVIEKKVSASYDAAVLLDDACNVLCVSERPLSWVHGTLLAPSSSSIAPSREGNNLSASSTPRFYDIRIKVTTTKLAQVDDELYKFACPGGACPIEVNNNGDPIPTKTSNSENVAFARRVDTRSVFRYESPANRDDDETPPVCMLATLSRGAHYESVDLMSKSFFLDFSLEIDTTPLVSRLSNVSCSSSTDAWMEAVLERVVAVGDNLPWLMGDDPKPPVCSAAVEEKDE